MKIIKRVLLSCIVVYGLVPGYALCAKKHHRAVSAGRPSPVVLHEQAVARLLRAPGEPVSVKQRSLSKGVAQGVEKKASLRAVENKQKVSIKSGDNGKKHMIGIVACDAAGREEVVDIVIFPAAVKQPVISRNMVSCMPEDTQTLLSKYIRRGNRELVTETLKRRVDVNGKDNEGQTPLLVAASCRHCTIAGLLCEKKADVNKANDKQVTPLLEASFRGHTEMVCLLIKMKANVNVVDEVSRTPLAWAVIDKNIAMIKALVAAGADSNAVIEGNSTITDMADPELRHYLVPVDKVEGGRTVPGMASQCCVVS